MRTRVPSIMTLVGLLSMSTAVLADPAVTSGTCRVGYQGEIIQLQNVDPYPNSGIFAKGTSSRGDSVRLSEFGTAIEIDIESSGAWSLSRVEFLRDRPTPVYAALQVNGILGWVTCDLEVR